MISGLRVFCTLFDSNYFSRGMAMYESLLRHCPQFKLYIFPFDEAAVLALQRLDLPNVVVVPQREFEDSELLRVKRQRSRAEYCWTCTASTVLYVLEKFGHSSCTYLDADIYFFSSPDALLAELGEKDVIITEHRYSPQHDFSATSGTYCVQFVTFKNSERGLRALRWWREVCLESCELNPAEGKCGDQKYLDDWPQRFEGIHVLEHLGGGLAPWNIQQYSFRAEQGHEGGIELASGARFTPIFYHYHGLKLWTSGRVQLVGGSYQIGKDAFEFFYRPYLRHLDELGRRLAVRGVEFDPHGRIADAPLTVRMRAARLKRRALRAVGLFRDLRADEVAPNFLDDII